ncbi:hypothetical protein SAMN05444394_3959 [Algoriphagus halophilus]|uniref:Uncharacterized protein n=1 Tax=Algoriphagus halophilus TaxID=226505 RepID=A0A1N6HSS8_9BACT|nr:hypothetical protein SAMN05444394_3959 [Algoriphagus halophilus]
MNFNIPQKKNSYLVKKIFKKVLKHLKTKAL